LTIYDDKYGIPEQAIPPHTSFEDLPDTFYCPVCESEKVVFKKVLMEVGVNVINLTSDNKMV